MNKMSDEVLVRNVNIFKTVISGKSIRLTAEQFKLHPDTIVIITAKITRLSSKNINNPSHLMENSAGGFVAMRKIANEWIDVADNYLMSEQAKANIKKNKF